MKNRIIRSALCGAITVSLAAGCSHSPASQSADAGETPLAPYWAAITAVELSEEDLQQSAVEPIPDPEAIIAECMHEQGFDYWPNVEEAAYDVLTASYQERIDNAEKNGYGLEAYSELEAPADDAPQNPNDEYRNSLSQGEGEAYDEAMYGTYIQERQADPDLPYDWTRGGCEGKADHALGSEYIDDTEPDAVSTPYDELIAMMEQLYDGMYESEAWQKVLDDWSNCMSAKGYHYSSWDQAVTALAADSNDLFAAYPGLPPQADYDRLYQLELQVAVADMECQQTIDVDAQERSIQLQLEEQFVKDNHDRLEEMRIWFNGQH